MSDRANIVTAEIETPDNLTDQVWRESERSGCTSEKKKNCRFVVELSTSGGLNLILNFCLSSNIYLSYVMLASV